MHVKGRARPAVRKVKLTTTPDSGKRAGAWTAESDLPMTLVRGSRAMAILFVFR
jgi:hypothetical protein